MSGQALHLGEQEPVLAFLEDRLRAPMLGSVLLAPLREFLGRPGKQLRARFVMLSWQLAGGRGAPPPGLPLALELLHAGSLIVDDVEDGTEERRGAPALHLSAGLPVALNAGNWLYFAALELLGELPIPDARLSLVLRRAHALLARCHEGQALDVGVRVSDVPQPEVLALVRAISERKTGGLASLCASLAAICAGASPRIESALAAFGSSFGVGLQILDDTGSIASEERRAKGEEDLRNGRATWAWAALAEALDPVSYCRLLAHPDLDEMRRLLGDRGRQLARSELQQALGNLRSAIGAVRALEQATALIGAMEKSYG
jgi:geranylgeranyl pyrophosphate synthase